jgi:hypothetical protein
MKLKLTSIKVESFVTNLEQKEKTTINGGIITAEANNNNYPTVAGSWWIFCVLEPTGIPCPIGSGAITCPAK